MEGDEEEEGGRRRGLYESKRRQGIEGGKRNIGRRRGRKNWTAYLLAIPGTMYLLFLCLMLEFQTNELEKESAHESPA